MRGVTGVPPLRHVLGAAATLFAIATTCAAAAPRSRDRRVHAGDAAGDTDPLSVVAAQCARGAHARNVSSALGDARCLAAATALLAGSVLADSALEHYRGAFENPGMFAPIVASFTTLGVALRAAVSPAAGDRRRRAIAYRSALGVGIAGLGFHLRNIGRRIGDAGWQRLFYGAPIAAPAALSAAAIGGIVTDRIAAPRPSRARTGRRFAAFASVALVATSAEAALLHFRGAFHNPLMWTPIAVPPVAALALARALRRPGRARNALARGCLRATVVVGAIGAALHAYGISRAMGGFANWSQNVVDGPPLPAPAAFCALALFGLVGLGVATAPPRP